VINKGWKYLENISRTSNTAMMIIGKKNRKTMNETEYAFNNQTGK
jgi:hypothetical protein